QPQQTTRGSTKGSRRGFGSAQSFASSPGTYGLLIFTAQLRHSDKRRATCISRILITPSSTKNAKPSHASSRAHRTRHGRHGASALPCAAKAASQCRQPAANAVLSLFSR